MWRKIFNSVVAVLQDENQRWKYLNVLLSLYMRRIFTGLLPTISLVLQMTILPLFMGCVMAIWAQMQLPICPLELKQYHHVLSLSLTVVSPYPFTKSTSICSRCEKRFSESSRCLHSRLLLRRRY